MIDLRSDTVTKPCAHMRELMAAADVGDDIYGGDPTVIKLQDMAAEMLGKEAALFAPSGTQTNLIALLCHCQRGDEYVVGQQAHTYKYEGGGAAVLGSIQPQPIEFETDGRLDLDKVRKAIKPYNQHFAKTRLLCLENTLSGVVLPLDYIQEAGEFCKEHDLLFHLDGARLFNAVVKTGVSVCDLVSPFDSVSICLSKGLGAPVGSLLVGSQEMIDRAVHWRKMLGGGMRQAGVLAAAGIYALEHNIDRLQQDHDLARVLAQGLSMIEGFSVDEAEVQTNMVFVDVPKGHSKKIISFMEEHGIQIDGFERMRLVTHLDISSDDIDKVIAAFKEYSML